MKKTLRRLASLLLVVTMSAPYAPALAVFDPVNDDTDLFRNNPNIAAERPNILIILDNTANWSSGGKFTAEKAALTSVVNSLDSSYNVGMMVMTQGGNCRTSNVDGGYVRFGIRQMTSANKTALVNTVGTDANTGFVDAPCNQSLVGDQGSSATGAQAMHEAYLYFSGLTSRSGITQVKRDYAGNANNATAGPLSGNPLSSSAATTYTSPITDICQKNYIIFISNGPFDNSDDAPSSQLYAGASGLVPGASPIALDPSGSQANWSDEYAQYLANSGVSVGGGNPKVYTYAVEVDPATTGQGPAHTALMRSMAQQGKGRYFGVTSANSGQAIVDALNAVFTEIQAVNSVFAASTLPVSVNVRGTNLNQLYIGVFRPDARDLPRWFGNLKAYQLKKDPVTGLVYSVDAAGNAAENSTTGFITGSAVSFWSSSTLTPQNYWSFRSSTVNGIGGSSDSPDGDLVEKGGAAQQVRARYYLNGVNGSPSRNLYTCTQGPNYPVCTGASPLSDTPFLVDNSDIDSTSLNLDTHLVSSLSAAVVKSVTALSDTRTVALDNSLAPVQISSITTNAITKTVTLNNSRAVSITAMSNAASTRSATCGKSANNVALVTFTSNHGITNGTTVVVEVPGDANAKWNTTGAVITVNPSTPTQFTYAANGVQDGPASCNVTTSNTVTNVTAPAHGFTSGQSVTIAGVTPTSPFTGTKTITVDDANSFHFSTTVSAAPTLSSATATGRTNIVTATISSGTFSSGTYSAGQQVTISGAAATTPSYNGTFTILSSPAPSSTAFSFQTSSAITTAASGTITAGQSGTTATATRASHGFLSNQSITVSGASPSGFNGTFNIFNVTTDTFDYTVAPGLGVATANPTILAAVGTGPTVTATLVSHGFTVGQSITIAGVTPSSHNAAWTVASVSGDGNSFTYSTGSALEGPSGTPTVRLTSSPRAYATAASHGFANNDSVTIAGAAVSGGGTTAYNGTYTITVIDGGTFSYVLPSAQGANTGSAVTATTTGTTARANATAHGFADGASVTIAGATPTGFNGTFTISLVDADNFTYSLGTTRLGTASGSITAVSTGSGASDRTNLINWIRGEDNYEDENANSSFADTRSTIHGDVLHSRPAVVNYNRRAAADPTNADNDVYIFYGGNDGVFRAIKGGFGSTTGDPSPGQEVWGFVAKEHFPNLRRLRLNSPGISSSYKKPYFFDGPIGTYTLDANNDGKLVATDNDKVYLYLTMRRGGRFIYALDVSDPLAPKLLWRKGCPSLSSLAADRDPATGCDKGWSELGYTWSEPKVVSINATSDPVLIFGAGYDPVVEDIDPATVTSSSASSVVSTAGTFDRTMGRGIYVVNARTGAILWQASGHARSDGTTHPYKVVSGMDYAIPSDVAVVVGDSAPKPFRAYVGDTGGNMWRLDFGDASPANWTVVKLASIADQSTASGRRKFLYPPDVVGGDTFDAVLAGTGDREHPFDTTIVNRMYMFKDKVRSTTPPVDAVTGAALQATITEGTGAGNPMLDVSSNCIQDASGCTGVAPQAAAGGFTASQSTANALNASNNYGWYLTFASGEKQVGATLASGGGAVQFGTNQPSASAGGGACSPNLGVARQYTIDFADGSAFTDLDSSGTTTTSDRSSIRVGGGFLPSPVLVYVGLGGTSGTGAGVSTSSGVPVGGTVVGSQLQVGGGSGVGTDPTGVVCFGANCSLAPGVQLYSRLRKFWYKELD